MKNCKIADRRVRHFIFAHEQCLCAGGEDRISQ
jgi:hypothetical protein